MKLRTRLLSIITTVVLLSVLAVTAQAQRGVRLNLRVHTYGCLAGTSETADLGDVFVNTGWQALDAAMLEDITALNRVYGVNVPLYFLNDGSKNAFFVALKFPSLMQADGVSPNTPVTGSVFFSAALLKDEFQEGKGSGMSIPAILGHEYAHAVQKANNFPYEGKWPELHADYLAGWFIALRGVFRLQDPNRAWVSISEKGDYNFFDKGHHGSPQERAEAFAAGYMLLAQGRQTSGISAYNFGLQFVKAKGAR
jgi:hypothetical protein